MVYVQNAWDDAHRQRPRYFDDVGESLPYVDNERQPGYREPRQNADARGYTIGKNQAKMPERLGCIRNV